MFLWILYKISFKTIYNMTIPLRFFWGGGGLVLYLPLRQFFRGQTIKNGLKSLFLPVLSSEWSNNSEQNLGNKYSKNWPHAFYPYFRPYWLTLEFTIRNIFLAILKKQLRFFESNLPKIGRKMLRCEIVFICSRSIASRNIKFLLQSVTKRLLILFFGLFWKKATSKCGK